MVRRTQTSAHDSSDIAELASHRERRTAAAERIEWMLSARRARRGGSDDEGGRSGPALGGKLLDDRELAELETRYERGITAVQIVDLFAARGVRFSEATFRKYVQLSLLPRSRRVGRKGKHRGSLGVYPAKSVRRINAIKRLMADGFTIEEIQQQFLRYTDVIETLEESLGDIFKRFESELASPRLEGRERKSLKRDIAEASRSADELMRRLDDLTQRVWRPREDGYGGSGAAGSAEELL